MQQINTEKQEILNIDGNVLVAANPGTGKTLLLAHKYLSLLQKGVAPEDILCLTFTQKAKDEMEERIVNLVNDNAIPADVNKICVHTFHSYAVENIEVQNLVPPTLLRYTIIRYLKRNKSFNYGDDYIANHIVPLIERHITYLKTFGILPDMIDIAKVQSLIESYGNYSKEVLDSYAEIFVDVFREYEKFKFNKGIDYADMLIMFHELKHKPLFEYVLIDELQDVNPLEAKMARDSGNVYFAVGDPKQSIMGFQGGTIANFEYFQDSQQRVLSENFRSGNEIIDYARTFYSTYTQNHEHTEQLESLANNNIDPLPLPKLYRVEKDKAFSRACDLAGELYADGKKVALIARTNNHVSQISGELEKRGISHSSTFFAASDKTKNMIIEFLKTFFTKEPEQVISSFFTPFSPVSLEKASIISDQSGLTLNDIFEQAPEIEKLIEPVKTIEDLNDVFKKIILPVSITYGRQYFDTAMAIYNTFEEAVKNIKFKSYERFIDYLNAAVTDNSSNAPEKQIVVTTIHKAKGKEWDHVIYLGSEIKSRPTFQDKVFGKIIEALDISIEEELEEEELRLDFVAFTRAKESLHLVPAGARNYNVGDIEKESKEAETAEYETVFCENMKRAYTLFLNREYDLAKEVLNDDSKWLIQHIENHFKNLKHLSFSAISDNAFEYLKERILKLKFFSKALSLGSEVHDIAEKILNGESPDYDPKLQPYIDNIREVIGKISVRYPEVSGAEMKLDIKLSDIFDIDDDIKFIGYIDAVFRNGDQYLLLDWKTNIAKSQEHNKYRKQLETYRQGFAFQMNIPLENIRTAIAYIGLRERVNTGLVNYELAYDTKPGAVFSNFTSVVRTLTEWRKDVNIFCREFIDQNIEGEYLWRAIAEQLQKEMG